MSECIEHGAGSLLGPHPFNLYLAVSLYYSMLHTLVKETGASAAELSLFCNSPTWGTVEDRAGKTSSALRLEKKSPRGGVLPR